jgi:hypothetical protein
VSVLAQKYGIPPSVHGGWYGVRTDGPWNPFQWLHHVTRQLPMPRATIDDNSTIEGDAIHNSTTPFLNTATFFEFTFPPKVYLERWERYGRCLLVCAIVSFGHATENVVEFRSVRIYVYFSVAESHPVQRRLPTVACVLTHIHKCDGIGATVVES